MSLLLCCCVACQCFMFYTTCEIVSEWLIILSRLQILFFFFCPHLPLTRSVWLAAPFAFQFRLVIFSSNTPQSADKWKCKLPLESQVQSFGEFCHGSFEMHGLGKERWRNVTKKINIKFSFRFICDGYLVFGIFFILNELVSEGENQPVLFPLMLQFPPTSA